MKFLPKYRVSFLELKEGRGKLKKGRGVARECKRDSLPLCTGLAGALSSMINRCGKFLFALLISTENFYQEESKIVSTGNGMPDFFHNSMITR